MTKIDLVYFNAGGGHRAAALALQEVIAQQRRPWQVRLVNLVDVLDPAAGFHRWTGFMPEDLYNVRLARGWTWGLATELKLLQRAIRLGHRWLVERLSRHWDRTRPDLIVSLIPNFNRAMHDAAQRAAPQTPFVTVMTDLADLPPHFWIEPGTAQHVVCGSDQAVRQARLAGVPADRTWLTTGMILRPAFHRLPALDREDARRALGLDPMQPTGVVLFGGHGSAQMLRIARTLDDVQLILMCGHNRRLANALQACERKARHAVVGFTADVPHFLRLGDFFIGKPGPGSLSEAAHLGLPILTFDNAATMPQERYNLQWLREHGLGAAVRNVRDLRAALSQVLAAGAQALPREALPGNAAVFEIPEILADVLATDQVRRAGRMPLCAASSSLSAETTRRAGTTPAMGPTR
ncbi:MAG: MGDG synthase family glycosyltransferase [Rubrivivax sp.]